MKSRKTIKDLALDRNDQGFSTAQTASVLGVSQRTIQRWIKKGRTLLEKSPRLKSRRLTPQQEDDVLAFVENNAGIFLDQVKEFVSETCGVCVSIATVCRLLSKHNFTRKIGMRVNPKYKIENGM